MSFFDWFRSKVEIDAQRAEMLDAIDADQKCTREMMPQGVQEWEIDPHMLKLAQIEKEYKQRLENEKLLKEHKEKLKNPKSIYLRKKK